MQLATELKPVSLIGFGDGAEGAAFTGINPATGSALEPKFFSATADDLERAARSEEPRLNSSHVSQSRMPSI